MKSRLKQRIFAISLLACTAISPANARPPNTFWVVEVWPVNNCCKVVSFPNLALADSTGFLLIVAVACGLTCP